MDKETDFGNENCGKLDVGPVMLKSKIKLTKESTFIDISKQMANVGSSLVLEALNLINENKANFVEQDEREATYAKKIDKSESKIEWNDKAINIIANRYSLNPNPGCWFNIFRIKD